LHYSWGLVRLPFLASCNSVLSFSILSSFSFNYFCRILVAPSSTFSWISSPSFISNFYWSRLLLSLHSLSCCLKSSIIILHWSWPIPEDGFWLGSSVLSSSLTPRFSSSPEIPGFSKTYSSAILLLLTEYLKDLLVRDRVDRLNFEVCFCLILSLKTDFVTSKTFSSSIIHWD
jgi:hypothetical protein